jgi:hypothetical protein
MCELMVQIAVSQYVGVLLLVFVKKDLTDAVRDVQTAEKGIGLLGFGVSVICSDSPD